MQKQLSDNELANIWIQELCKTTSAITLFKKIANENENLNKNNIELLNEINLLNETKIKHIDITKSICLMTKYYLLFIKK